MIVTAGYVGTVLLIAIAGHVAYGAGVNAAGSRVECGCQATPFFSLVFLFGIPLSLLAGWAAGTLLRFVRHPLGRWFVLAVLAMVPFALHADRFTRICHLALAPCMIAATLIEHATRAHSELPTATALDDRA